MGKKKQTKKKETEEEKETKKIEKELKELEKGGIKADEGFSSPEPSRFPSGITFLLRNEFGDFLTDGTGLLYRLVWDLDNKRPELQQIGK